MVSRTKNKIFKQLKTSHQEYKSEKLQLSALELNNLKYHERIEKNRENGKKGGRPRKINAKKEEPNGLSSFNLGKEHLGKNLLP